MLEQKVNVKVHNPSWKYQYLEF